MAQVGSLTDNTSQCQDEIGILCEKIFFLNVMPRGSLPPAGLVFFHTVCVHRARVPSARVVSAEEINVAVHTHGSGQRRHGRRPCCMLVLVSTSRSPPRSSESYGRFDRSEIRFRHESIFGIGVSFLFFSLTGPGAGSLLATGSRSHPLAHVAAGFLRWDRRHERAGGQVRDNDRAVWVCGRVHVCACARCLASP